MGRAESKENFMNGRTFKRKLALFERLRGELQDIVYEIFPKYCALTNRKFKNLRIKGFQRWSESLDIDVEDPYDEHAYSVVIPLEWFYDFSGAKSKLEEELRQKEEEEKIREETARLAQAKSLEETERAIYLKLKSKYENSVGGF